MVMSMLSTHWSVWGRAGDGTGATAQQNYRRKIKMHLHRKIFLELSEKKTTLSNGRIDRQSLLKVNKHTLYIPFNPETNTTQFVHYLNNKPRIYLAELLIQTRSTYRV